MFKHINKFITAPLFRALQQLCYWALKLSLQRTNIQILLLCFFVTVVFFVFVCFAFFNFCSVRTNKKLERTKQTFKSALSKNLSAL